MTGEGSGTHEEKEGEFPSSNNGLGGFPAAETKSDKEPGTLKEEAREFQSFEERRSSLSSLSQSSMLLFWVQMSTVLLWRQF